MGKFIFEFLFWGSCLYFPISLFGDVIVLWEEWWGGCIVLFKLLMLADYNPLKVVVYFVGLSILVNIFSLLTVGSFGVMVCLLGELF